MSLENNSINFTQNVNILGKLKVIGDETSKKISDWRWRLGKYVFSKLKN